jgi:hypothetical protein
MAWLIIGGIVLLVMYVGFFIHAGYAGDKIDY